MSLGIQQGAAAISALEKWQDVIASNMASSAVAGHKKSAFAVEAQAGGTITTKSNAGFDSILQTKIPLATGRASFADGDVISTGKPTDCAIQGEGFFSVSGENGNVYTRNGEFHLNSQRILVDSLGRSVVGKDGEIRFTGAGDISIDSEGNVYEGSDKVGSLQVTRFENPDQLSRDRNGFRSLDDLSTNPSVMDTPNVVSMHIESSNSEAVQEMANLIKATRAHEANLKIISEIDQMMDRSVKILGNTR